MKITFIGDVHGKFTEYRKIIDASDCPTIQVGDFGIGFYWQDAAGNKHRYNELPQDHYDHWFIRGNHDNPYECRLHPQNIQDASMWNGIFCMGGALSIDKEFRTEGLDWWTDEELSIEKLDQAVDLYETLKPEVVVTHDGPEGVIPHMFNWYSKSAYPSRTRDALSIMLKIHRPKLWIFGHWHKTVKYEDQGTTFLCLNELQTATYYFTFDDKSRAVPVS